jgi:Ca2+/H+ antiporter, TMEM165/GDT1 family
MKRFWMLKGLKVLLFVGVALSALGFAVMSLWNAVLPTVASVHAITFVQALGLLVLARILFGGFRRHGRGHWRQRMRERWAHMTPEQREQLRASFASRSGRCGPLRPTPTV